MNYTYSEYISLLKYLNEQGYCFGDYENYQKYPKTVILRHDIDTSIEKALRFAEIEEQLHLGISASYFVMLSTDFYNIASAESLKMIERITSLGGKIGLHFDEVKYCRVSDDEWSKDSMIEYILKEKEILELITGIKINTVSMHRPSQHTLETDLQIPGMINTYGKVFFEGFKYISDSYHRWREDPWETIDKKYPRLHLLTHAFWYNEAPLSRSESFRQYISEGEQFRYDLLEKNLLPPGVSLKQSFEEENG